MGELLGQHCRLQQVHERVIFILYRELSVVVIEQISKVEENMREAVRL